jgi:hypothetical protein
LLSDRGQKAIEVAERYADGEASAEQLAEAQPPFIREGDVADNGTHFATAPRDYLRSWASQAVSFAAWCIAEEGPAHELEEASQCHLVRDVFGPLRFRPVAVDPSWLTSTVTSLAAGIYADRAFDRMPILADALEEAGCDHADILTHCRGDGPHVRGCWVVNLLLGKE